MRPQNRLLAIGLMLVTACGGEQGKTLQLIDPLVDAGTSDQAKPEPDSESENVSRVDPILEGRKFRIQIRNPLASVDADLETVDVPFYGAPRAVPEADLPIKFHAATSAVIKASWLVSLACAHEMAASTDFIVPGSDYAPNPGTYPRTEGVDGNITRILRDVPLWPMQTIFLWTEFLAQAQYANTCNPAMHWAQMMNLCVADRYLELASAAGPYEMVLNPIAAPRSKLPPRLPGEEPPPPTSDSDSRCNDSQPFNRCTQLGATIRSSAELADSLEERTHALREYLLWPVSQGLDLTASPVVFTDGFSDQRGLPQRDGLSDAEYVEALLPFYTRPVARFPIQDASDKATLALLAANYYMAAQDIGQWFVNCQLDGDIVPEDERWVDTYDRRMIRVNEVVVTQLVEAMDGSVKAAAKAEEWIKAAANEYVAGDASDVANQMFWRGRTNSRLECVGTWTGLSPELFQDPGLTPDELDQSSLYQVYPWGETTLEIELAENVIRDARVNPELIVEGGVETLAEAIRASLHADMPNGFSDLDYASDGLTMLQTMGIAEEDLRSAAYRIIDTNRALGRAIVQLDGENGTTVAQPIPLPEEGAQQFFYTHGVSRSEAKADRSFLYARSVGVNSYNGFPAGNPAYLYQGVTGSLFASQRALQRLSERFGTLQGSTVVPFFVADEPRPSLGVTTPSSAKDGDIAGTTQAGLSLAHTWTPEVMQICPSGTISFFSDDLRLDVPEAWRGEAGLECALSGRFGDVPCAEEDFMVEYSDMPVNLGAYRMPESGKFEMAGEIDLSTVPEGERIYFTRIGATGAREVILGITRWGGSFCNIYTFGEEIMKKVNDCLAPRPNEPAEPEICCEGLPCDLSVPLEDSLQTTAPRDIESSFMHYLSLARQAADRADSLGEQMFRQGLEMDQRAEVAREELENLCGGVANVEQLGPKPCTSDGECGTQQCSAQGGLVGGDRYCMGGGVTDALRNSSRIECQTNLDCGDMGFVCAGDGDVRFCATACNPAPCGEEQCLDSPNGRFCADVCSDDTQCGVGMACREGAGVGAKICVPKPTDDLQSIEACLNVGEDNPLVPAALGKQPLHAWQFPGLPVCVCRSGADCEPAYNVSTGMANCPSIDAPDPENMAEFVPDGAMYVPIKTTLGFDTDIEGGSGSPISCQALAELRVGLADGEDSLPDGRLLESALGAIMEQPWMTQAGFAKYGASVDPQYDTYGFLTILVNKSPWLTTGSAETGPVQEDVFPNVPLIPSDDRLCTTPDPNGGYPLQCRSFGGDGALNLTNDDLVHITQVMRAFAGARRIPLARMREMEFVPTSDDAPNAGAPFVIANGPSFPADFLISDAPAALLRPVAAAQFVPIFPTGGTYNYDRPTVANILLGNGSNEYGEDNLHVLNPVCLEMSTGTPPDDVGSYFDDIGCGETTVINGRRVLARFRAYANGQRHNGLWAGKGSGGGDSAARASGVLFNKNERLSLYKFLEKLSNDTHFDTDSIAPIVTQDWNTEDGRINVGPVLDALEMGCMMSTTPRGPQVGLTVGCNPMDNAASAIRGPDDFPKLTNRLRCAANKVDGELKRMWVPEIPKAIATAIAAHTVTDTVPNFRGEYAQTVAQLQGAFQTVAESTRTIGSQLRAFANELDQAQSTIKQIDNEGKILDWKMVADISTQIAACGEAASGMSAGAAFSCANAAVQIASIVAINSLQQQNVGEDKKQALIQVQMQFNDRLDTIQAAAESLRKGYADISSLQAELQTQRSKAERAMAKVLFLGRDSTGRIYNVNTAMRRNMNTLKARYENSLVDAKRMSFIARRAIEQRLAMSLEDMEGDLHLVEAPSKWVNSACSMTGIDYDRIRDEDSAPTGGSLTDDFSAGFIGDYVTKLENFVESYRFAYPFRDGSDVAVVSLRDDILGVKADCSMPGPNLLYSTTDMLDIDDPESGTPTWRDVSDAGKSILLAPTGAPIRRADVSEGGISPSPQLAGGSGYRMSASMSAPDPSARAYWGQEVTLQPGVYMLSWYERYGDTDNGCEMIPEQTWNAVEGEIVGAASLHAPQRVPLGINVQGDPNLAELFTQRCWRRWSQAYEVSDTGPVLVRFGLQDDEQSWVWGQPQLERVDVEDLYIDIETNDYDTEALPKVWFPTSQSLEASIGKCEDTTGEIFQQRFRGGETYCEQVCPDGTGDSCADYESNASFAKRCYHELRFEIGSGALERGELIPSIARANFNYRFSRFGVNLVGTGLRNCENSEYPSSCYASGFIQYSLRHDGPFNVINHEGDPISVALFPARVEHAKALTAERYVTNPISSADRALMEDYWRSELRGRPIQGAYTLRIYNTDDENVLDMSKLEDVQLIFDYNYWTRSEQ